MRVFYFGCIGEAGHFWWAKNDGFEGKRPVHAHGSVGRLEEFPVDGTLCPPPTVTGEVEGLANLLHVTEVGYSHQPWTFLAFWDRSGDSRPGSNSVFAIEGVHGFYAAVDAAKAAFPSVWARFKFNVERWQSPAA